MGRHYVAAATFFFAKTPLNHGGGFLLRRRDDNRFVQTAEEGNIAIFFSFSLFLPALNMGCGDR